MLGVVCAALGAVFDDPQTSLSDLKEGGMTSKLDSLSFGEKIGERRNAGG